LAGREEPCPKCGYNLRDLTGDRCPECGDALVLRVQLVEPKLAAMLTGLVGLSAGFGLNALLLIYFVIVSFLRGPSGGMGTFLVVNSVGLVAQGAALAWWLRAWSRIRKLPGRTRWWLAAGCCALSMANIVFFSLLVN
jgi:hypothetical protein